MNLSFKLKLADEYTSRSQKVRVLTEQWVNSEAYCPNCGHSDLDQYANNKPVADFFCQKCREEYELKSKSETIGTKVLDGAYRTMVERLQSSNNPNFLLLSYDLQRFEVLNFLVIPKHFFIPEIIERRKPLSSTARRAGWVGCNILLHNIPQTGKIFFVRNRIVTSKAKVLSEWQKTLFLRESNEIGVKGWLLDVMRCIEQLRTRMFSLDDVYAFESTLVRKYPGNRHIKDKIRQQLQVLRDKGYLEFVGRGRYRRT